MIPQNEKMGIKVLILVLFLMLVTASLAVIPLVSAEGDDNKNDVDEDPYDPDDEEPNDDDEDEVDDDDNETDEEDEDEIDDDDDNDDEKEDDEDDDDDEDEDEDGVDDDDEEWEEREVEIEVDEDEVEIESELKNGTTKDKFEVEFDAHNKIELELKYREKTSDTKTKLEFRVEFREILEFNDTNSDGLYDKNDTVVSKYDLKDTDYENIVYTTATTPDNETKHIISAQTTDGVFKVVLHVVGSFAKVESGILSPTAVKIDIIISGYEYKGNDTLLALHTKINTDSKTKIKEESHDESEGYAEDEEEVEISAGEYTAFFSWVENATVDGVQKPVKATALEDTNLSGCERIYLIYAKGDNIVHDPKLGVVGRTSMDTDKDGYKDAFDVFLNDPAASLDTDKDGYPDSWNPGKTKADSTTNLELDMAPNDPDTYRDEPVVSSHGRNNIWVYSLAAIVAVVVIVLVNIYIKKRG